MVKAAKKTAVRKSAPSAKRARPKDAPPVSSSSTTMSAATMEQWHKRVARAAGLISLTLARRKRSATFVDDLLELLAPVVEEMRTHQ